MIKNYFKIAWRNLVKNRTSSFINIGGLAVGMAVAMLIGLWIWDELSFDTYHQNYNRIAQVMQSKSVSGTVGTSAAVPIPLEAELKKSYGDDFRHIVMSSWTEKHILATGDKKITYTGNFMEPEAPEMFSLNMISGSRNGLQDPTSILISQSIAKALFGHADPLDKLISFDNAANFKVSGVYADLPGNTTLHDVAFIAPWHFYYVNILGTSTYTDWGDNSFQMYVQMADNADMAQVSAKIRDVKLKKVSREDVKYKPVIFLHPMSKWHLYSKFENGINTGGDIQYVQLFCIIGAFVLLLACINFMNLSTARSEKRAKEVGIRKAVGSVRGQLIGQFFSESLLITVIAFLASLALVSLTLPFFNDLTGKQLAILWTAPVFWIVSAGFTFFTGIVAGSYPALYLSSFNPVKVLKGTFKAGRFATMPRKVLVIMQFTVCVMLIIGTIVIFKQVEFVKDRPVGYSRDDLVYVQTVTDDLHDHFKALEQDLLSSGAIADVAESSSPTTGINNNRGDINWSGKAPGMTDEFANVRVTSGYGKTVGWQFVAGRDFLPAFLSDSMAVVLNEAAVRYMGLKHPVGEILRMGKRELTVIGVVKDMVMESPYDPVKQTLFYISHDSFGYLNIRINPNMGSHEALKKIAAVCKTYSPSVPFAYRFANDEYAKKFATEERVGQLASSFAILAIFISCIGLFGMASFMAEQKVKEIGVRKVLGATVFSLWRLMSKEFVLLLIVSLLIAIPLAYNFMHHWLQNYTYHTAISWWVFTATAGGAILITLLTVSYQSIKAALANPVKSLRSE